MSMPYLPGWGDTLAQNLPQIGQSLQKIFNPNHDLQEGIKRAVATNPELAQHLANLESQNPGTLNSLLGNSDITNILTSLSPDAATKQQMALQPDIDKLLQDPTSRSEVLAKETGTLTPVQRSMQGLQVQNAQQNIQQGEQQIALGNEELQKRQQQKQIEDIADVAVKGKPNWNIATFDKDFTSEQQGAIFSSDKYGKLFQTKLAQYNRHLDQAFAISMRSQDRADRRAEIQQQWQQQKLMTFGFDMAKKSNGQVTPESAVALMEPAGINQAIALSKEPGHENDPLVRAYKWQTSMQGKEFFQDQYKTASNEIKDMIDSKTGQLKKIYSPELLSSRVANLNHIGQQLGIPAETQVNTVGNHWYLPNALSNHQEITSVDRNTGTVSSNPTKTEAPKSKGYEKSKALIQSSPKNQQKALLTQLALQNPADANQIAKELGL